MVHVPNLTMIVTIYDLYYDLRPKYLDTFNNIKDIVEHHYRVQKFRTVYFRTLTDSVFSASEVLCPECTRAQKQVLYKLLI